jgi:hypothetical protein
VADTSGKQEQDQDVTPNKRCKRSNEVTDLEVAECCLNFLKSDLNFYRQIWNWDEFIVLESRM